MVGYELLVLVINISKQFVFTVTTAANVYCVLLKLEFDISRTTFWGHSLFSYYYV